MNKPRLPTEASERKKMPLAAVFDYFDLALAEVAKVTYQGNLQHNPGATEMVWDRSKSTDQWDCLLRHFVERGTVDSDGARHSAKLAWRALAALQIELEESFGVEPSRASRIETCPSTAESVRHPSPVQLELPLWDDTLVPSTSPKGEVSADETTLVGFPIVMRPKTSGEPGPT